ncbi:MAG: hypothetical protein HYX53_14405 [Chloroflexi bacterium]|nr:hypothetical protein [Chloroflexota bacterium]
MADYPERYRGSYVPFEQMTFDIRREGRGWHGDEFEKSYWAMPEKMEATDGKLYYDEEERLKMLGALLENIGVDRAIRFGDPAVWKAAIAALDG